MKLLLMLLIGLLVSSIFIIICAAKVPKRGYEKLIDDERQMEYLKRYRQRQEGINDN